MRLILGGLDLKVARSSHAIPPSKHLHLTCMHGHCFGFSKAVHLVRLLLLGP